MREIEWITLEWVSRTASGNEYAGCASVEKWPHIYVMNQADKVGANELRFIVDYGEGRPYFHILHKRDGRWHSFYYDRMLPKWLPVALLSLVLALPALLLICLVALS